MGLIKIRDYNDFLMALHKIPFKNKEMPLGEIFGYLELDTPELRELFNDIKALGVREYHRERQKKYRALLKTNDQ